MIGGPVNTPDLSQVIGPLAYPARFMATLADMVRGEWIDLADRHLNASDRSKGEYKASIQPATVSETSAQVTLEGTKANMLEQGMGPGGIGTEGSYDVRKFLLQPTTRNIKHGKKGMYLNVPFDHAAATVRALGGEPALKLAKALRARLSLDTSKGRLTGWAPTANPNQPKRLPAGLAPNQRPNFNTLPDGGVQHPHATDPLAGLVRQLTVYSGANAQSTYRTWRTASEGGKPWVSRGVTARRIADRVLAAMPDILTRMVGAL